MLPSGQKRRCLFLPNWQWERLASVADQACKTNSELIRMCLDRCLTAGELNKLLPCFSGQIDLR